MYQKQNKQAAEQDIVDFSYIEDLGSSKPDFIRQVLTIFMDNTPAGLKELEQLIRKGRSWDKISKQAHFLKSSVSVVKIRGMHEKLQQIESIAKEKNDKKTVIGLLDEITDTFQLAERIILEKMESLQ